MTSDSYSVDDLTRALLVSTRVTAEVGPDLKGEVQFHLLLLTLYFEAGIWSRVEL